MRLPPGSDPEKATFGYLTALRGIRIECIEAGVEKFLRGECKDVSPKFCPYPPELANICRTVKIYYDEEPMQLPPPAPPPSEPYDPGERARMRLKMPMWQAAFGNGPRIEQLATANREGLGAMIVMASSWGVAIPQELFDVPEDQAEREWKRARNAAWNEIDRNPAPFMKGHVVTRDEVRR